MWDAARLEKSDVTKTWAFGESSNIPCVCIGLCSTAVYRGCITCTSETNFSAGYIFRVASIVVGLFIICILLASKVAFMSSLTNTKFLLDVLLSSFFIVEQCSLTVSSVSPLLLLVGWSFFLIHFDWLLVPGLQVSLLLGLFPLLRFLNRFFIACSHDD